MSLLKWLKTSSVARAVARAANTPPWLAIRAQIDCFTAVPYSSRNVCTRDSVWTCASIRLWICARTSSEVGNGTSVSSPASPSHRMAVLRQSKSPAWVTNSVCVRPIRHKPNVRTVIPGVWGSWLELKIAPAAVAVARSRNCEIISVARPNSSWPSPSPRCAKRVASKGGISASKSGSPISASPGYPWPRPKVCNSRRQEQALALANCVLCGSWPVQCRSTPVSRTSQRPRSASTLRTTYAISSNIPLPVPPEIDASRIICGGEERISCPGAGRRRRSLRPTPSWKWRVLSRPINTGI